MTCLACADTSLRLRLSSTPHSNTKQHSLMFSKLGVQALDDSDDSAIQMPVGGGDVLLAMLGYRWEGEEGERGVETRVIMGVCTRGGAATRCGALSESGDADDIGECTRWPARWPSLQRWPPQVDF